MPVRVLVVDDSAVARLAIARRLRLAGFDVVERDSCAATAGVDSGAFEAALLDYELGDGTGVDVAARLREGNAALPIAFFTSERRDIVIGRTAAFGPIFTKPAELDEAIAWVARAHT